MCEPDFGKPDGAGPGLDEGVGYWFTRNANFIGLSVTVMLRRLRIFGQRDKLKADRSKGA
jgi:hypothetical protein